MTCSIFFFMSAISTTLPFSRSYCSINGFNSFSIVLISSLRKIKVLLLMNNVNVSNTYWTSFNFGDFSFFNDISSMVNCVLRRSNWSIFSGRESSATRNDANDSSNKSIDLSGWNLCILFLWRWIKKYVFLETSNKPVLNITIREFGSGNQWSVEHVNAVMCFESRSQASQDSKYQ